MVPFAPDNRSCAAPANLSGPRNPVCAALVACAPCTRRACARKLLLHLPSSSAAIKLNLEPGKPAAAAKRKKEIFASVLPSARL